MYYLSSIYFVNDVWSNHIGQLRAHLNVPAWNWISVTQSVSQLLHRFRYPGYVFYILLQIDLYSRISWMECSLGFIWVESQILLRNLSFISRLGDYMAWLKCWLIFISKCLDCTSNFVTKSSFHIPSNSLNTVKALIQGGDPILLQWDNQKKIQNWTCHLPLMILIKKK